LYDLQADPYELNNLAGLDTYKEMSKVLSERLRKRMVDAGEAEPTITPAPERKRSELPQPYWWREASAEEGME